MIIPETHCSPSKPDAQGLGQTPSFLSQTSEPAQLPHELAQFSPYFPSSHSEMYIAYIFSHYLIT